MKFKWVLVWWELGYFDVFYSVMGKDVYGYMFWGKYIVCILVVKFYESYFGSFND